MLYHFVNGTAAPVGEAADPGIVGITEKEAGDGSGTPAKSAKSVEVLISCCPSECARMLTRIASRNWRCGWLGASKETIEQCRHRVGLAQVKSTGDKSCVFLLLVKFGDQRAGCIM